MQDVGGETLPPVVKVVVTFFNFKVPLNYFNYWNKNTEWWPCRKWQRIILVQIIWGNWHLLYLLTTERSAATHPNSVWGEYGGQSLCVCVGGDMHLFL